MKCFECYVGRDRTNGMALFLWHPDQGRQVEGPCIISPWPQKKRQPISALNELYIYLGDVEDLAD